MTKNDNDALGFLLRQFDTAWSLCSYHLRDLSTDECLWRPAKAGPHVHQSSSGVWQADWPEHEGYDLGPPSIAWTSWHLGFWWSMALDHSFGPGQLARDQIPWPGSGEDVCSWINELQARWREALSKLTNDDLQSNARTKWPIQDRPFGDVIAWVNIELMKNAAEIGYARFLYTQRLTK